MRRLYKTGNIFVAAMIILATVLAIFLPVIDLNEHFQDYLVHFLIFLIFSGLMGLVINNKIVLYTSFSCAAALAIFLKNASNTELKNPKLNEKDKITVVHLNMSLISDIATVQNIIRDSTIDVISFQEYTPDWANIIPLIISSNFPYAYEDVRMDLFGKSIFSRIPIQNPKVIEFLGIPNIELQMEVGEEIFTILSLYLTPALDNRSKGVAKSQIEELNKYCLSEKKTRIIMGEFNQVYWSHDIITFRTKTGLLNSRRNVSPNTFKMPYNHIFYTSNVECYYFDEIRDDSGEYVGSKSSFQLKSDKRKKRKS